MSTLASFCAEPCPSEAEVLALICGELESDALARLLSHTERCSNCALVVAEAGLALGQTEDLLASHSAPRASAVFAPGQLVASRYLIERRVGRGGMGEVYAALDQELNDRVALKTISPALGADPKIVDRFKLELRLARSIAHPSVCRVLEFGRHELSSGASQCFFTLQFIEGLTLRRQLLEREQLGLTAALAIARDLALGLQAIHDQSIVHRDIKPENVMLPSASGTAAVWVDFGLARVDLRETRSAGLLAGTPDYAAPELLRGDIASRASDLYAFGVVMFEVLTGVLPFARSASFAAASERARAHAAPPSALRHEVPPALDALVLECLEVAPERRPASAEHIAGRLSDLAHALQAAPKSPEMAAPVAARRTTPRWHWILGSALAAAVATSLDGIYSRVSAAAPQSAAPAAVATAATVPAASTLTIALAPAPRERKVELKRSPVVATSAIDARSAAPATSQVPPVTDFGGRR